MKPVRTGIRSSQWNARSPKALRLVCRDAGISARGLNRKQMATAIAARLGQLGPIFLHARGTDEYQQAIQPPGDK